MRFVCFGICVCNEKQCTHLGVCQINSAIQADLDLLNCKIGLKKSWKMFHISRSNANSGRAGGISEMRSGSQKLRIGAELSKAGCLVSSKPVESGFHVGCRPVV